MVYVRKSCRARPAAQLGNFHSYRYPLCLKIRTDITPRPGVVYRLTPTLCQPPLSVLFRQPVRSAQKLELAVLNHCFARVCTTWRRSSILDFLHLRKEKSSLILGQNSSSPNEQSNES
jgi:hypothetical protein